ncbi:MAG: hypothetical protein ACRDY2_01355 [Acidimicrobiales bacterium]
MFKAIQEPPWVVFAGCPSRCQRLRSTGWATGCEHLNEVVAGHRASQDEVASALRELGYHPTTRLKTSETIVDKLKREAVASMEWLLTALAREEASG